MMRGHFQFRGASPGCQPVLVCLALVLATMPLLRAAEATVPAPEVELKSTDRILICAPHPDDEVLGCAGVIQKAVALKIPCKIMFLTDGDDNELSFLVYRMHPVVLPRAARRATRPGHRPVIGSMRSGLAAGWRIGAVLMSFSG